MSSESQLKLDDEYVHSVEEFLSVIPEDFLKTLKQKMRDGHDREALKLVCQYVVKFFTYIPYKQCYHHGHFVQGLLQLVHNQK